VQLHRVSNKSPVKLGKELGRGGEGAVHLVQGAVDLVAKVYLKPPTPAKVDKLKSMSRHANPALLDVAAWPVDLLADEHALVRGFLMPRVGAREDLHELYTPKSRRRSFPTADFRFLVRVATNLSRAFAQVHSRGNVIGDVNHGNALVGRDGTVRLIDCDSFQVRDSGRVFTCDVGVPLFTPPELHGQKFRGLRRTSNHDGFGLAVLLFHLLYLGRHPFAGKYVDGDMPIERAIAESRFVYGSYAAGFGMTPPPGTLSLADFGLDIALLFERAFAPPGDHARPTPLEWIDALRGLEQSLVRCVGDASHHHVREQACCWCAYELHWRTRVFGQKLTEAVTFGSLKVARLWDAITAVKKPARIDPVEIPPSLEPGVALVGWIEKMVEPMRNPAVILKRAHVRECRDEVVVHANRWNELCADKRFDELFAELGAKRDQLLALPAQRATALKALSENVASRQRDAFLSLFMIDHASPPLVSHSELATLASYGIDSADDVLRHIAVFPREISIVSAANLRIWANDCANRFEFDASQGVDPQDIRELDTLLSSQQESGLETLAKGASRLAKLARMMEREREEARERLSRAHERLALARVKERLE
jgi:DNA-binding helix-hairpin-helix protein with protein kinase domain